MHWFQGKRLENEKIERPLQQVRWRWHLFPLIFDNNIAPIPVGCQGVRFLPGTGIDSQ
jgi:hypothetical protein